MDSKITFPITDKIFIEILIPGNETELYRYDEVTIKLKLIDKEITIYADDFVIEALRSLDGILEKVIKGKLVLHPSISEIGYRYNEALNDSPNLVYENFEGRKWWVGENYLLWSTNSKYSKTTWMYNKNGDVYLEITPNYKWIFDEPNGDEKFIEYEEFMKKYKADFVFKLNNDLLVQWKKRCEKLLKIIDKNG